MVMNKQNIDLHIEELVLEGFAPGERYRIAATVERELAALFAQQGAPHSLIRGGEIDRLDGGAFEAVQDSKPEAIGARVAQAVYGGLKR